MTAMSFGAMDADEPASQACGPQVQHVLPERLESSMKGDNRETRPLACFAVTVALYALSLSDVNATWMHTRKESMLEMKEALEENHRSSSAEQKQEDDDLIGALQALDIAIGRCKPPALTAETPRSPSPTPHATGTKGNGSSSSVTAPVPAPVEARGDGATVVAVLTELALKIEHYEALEQQRAEHEAALAARIERRPQSS